MYYNKFLSFFSSKNISIPKKVLINVSKNKVNIINTHTNDVKVIHYKNGNLYTKFTKNKKANKKI